MRSNLTNLRVLSASVLFALLLAIPALATAQPGTVQAEDNQPLRLPDQLFIQAGFADEVRTTTLGAIWNWTWRRPMAGGELGGYWEFSFGRWATSLVNEPNDRTWVTQVGVTPVLRWTPGAGRWFIEVGIGANLVLPIYQNRAKRFSTTFNFGDHLSVGRRFGSRAQHEFTLRAQHYSNADIERPNPGQNFIQLRYGHRF